MIEKMDIQVPRKPEKLADKPANRKGKRKAAFKDDGSLQKKKFSSKLCALCDKHRGAKTTHNTGGIVESMRRTGSLKRHSNPENGRLPSINLTTSLLSQWKILSRK